MTDDRVLSALLSTSISFLEVKEPITGEKVKEWGDTLYDVYEYLVDRLEDSEGARETVTTLAPQEVEEIPDRGEAIPRGSNSKALQVFHIRNVENLNINASPG